AAVRGVAFSPDGMRVASCGSNPRETGDAHGEVKVWDTATGKLLLDVRGHSDTVHSVAFSPDGGRLLSAAVEEVKDLDAATGKQRFDLAGRQCAVFSPGGKQIAALSFLGVTLWDSATGREIRSIRNARQGWLLGFIYTLAYSPDGTTLATTSVDATITVWD